MEHEILLDIQHVSKSFGLTRALKDVSFQVRKGEVRGIIGENGSGKSTVSNIIAGVYSKDEGKILLAGKELNTTTVVEAEANGIALIVQEIGTIGDISVASNIFLGNEKRFGSKGIISYRKMNREAEKALELIGIQTIYPEEKADSYNLEERKIIEIAKAFYTHPQLLIVDETANALSSHGRSILYTVIEEVKKYGGTVLFITHDLEELVKICDSVTILRDGVYIDTCHGEDMVINELKVKMVGREMSDHYYRSDSEGSRGEQAVMSLQNIFTSVLKNISLELHEGEILGIGGLSDCRMHELGRLMFGLDQPYSGKIALNGKAQKLQNPVKAIKCGIGYVSKNRDTEAVILQDSVKNNVCLCSLDKISRMGFAALSKENAFADKWIDKLKVKVNSRGEYVASLSGGNKQKVVLAKWLGRGSGILILDCPTRGIDIGVKEAIYHLMEELKAQGTAILLISEELPELIGMSDRVLIMKDGQIVCETMRGPEVTESLLIKEMI
ncbi:galactose/methyl galactoside import ATP-binding protein MglA [Lachnospiraceae bacterium]|nr:galactose/methyl galactoside import ATP-binding protein MglA [Lachnospiraceae bacterium]